MCSRLLTRRAVHGVCLLLCTLGLVADARPASALDSSRALTQYGHETWTSRQGLPQDTIQAITQTEDGYLWLATPAGLVRFDGMRFEVIGDGVVGPNRETSGP